MRLAISHRTTYDYSSPVRYSIQYLRLTPRNDAEQRVRQWDIEAPGRLSRQVDAFGNVVHVMTITQPHDRIALTVSGEVDTAHEPGHPIEDGNALPPAAFLVGTHLTGIDEAIRNLALRTLATGDDDARFDRLMSAILEQVSYTTGSTDVFDTAAQALAKGAGVCQDHAHLFLACCRAAGIPARYVSGYLFTGDAGHLASHAWADVHLAGRGWVSYDTTHRRLADDRYCRLAVGRDYLDASPVRGIRQGGSGERLDVSVRVGTAPGRAEQQQ